MDGMTLAQLHKDRTDEALAGAAQSGDLEAYTLLIARYRDVAFAYAFACLGNTDEAEDAAQEAFVRAYLHLPQFRTSQIWGAWLMRILRNHCTDLKRRKCRTETPLSDLELPSGLPSPETAALQREQQRELYRAICRLPEKYRIPLTMYYTSRRTYREIALALNLPESTITGRLALGLRKLRLTLAEENL